MFRGIGRCILEAHDGGFDDLSVDVSVSLIYLCISEYRAKWKAHGHDGAFCDPVKSRAL